MKLLKSLMLTIMLVGFFAPSSQASHVSGGNITWECLGGNTYLLRLTLYRDCSGTSMPTSINVNSSGSTPSYTSGTFSLTNTCGVTPTFSGGSTMTLVSTTEVSQLCPPQIPNSACNGGTLPGMEEYVYEVQVTLPDCDCWTFAYTLCCRNSAITNITAPGSDYSTIESTLCNGSGPSCNSGPTFTSQPIPYICQNVPICYDYGVVEPDGDCLSFAFTSALNSGNPSGYVGGYSAGAPIPGITIDPATGQICFTPTTIGNFVVTIMVTETDCAGTTIGTYMQDIQFVVQNCPNTPPDAPPNITGTTGSGSVTGSSSIQLCDGDNFCTNVVFTDVNAVDILTLTSNVTSVLPGATFTVTGTNPATATICWTENIGGPAFYSFTVDAEDDACPVPGINSYTVDVTVLDPTDPLCASCNLVANLASQVNVSCNGGNDGSLTINASGGPMPYQYSIDGGTTWQGSSTFGSLPAGNYTITVEDNSGCQVTVNVTITQPTAVAVNVTGTTPVSCNGGSDGTITVAGSGGTPGYQYSIDGGATWQGSGTFTGLANGSYTITIEDANGCQSTVNGNVIQPNPVGLAVVSTTDATCGLANGSFEVSGSGGTPGYQYSDDGGATWQGSGIFNGVAAGSYTITVEDANGCQTTVNVVINDLSGITASITAQVDVTCNGGNDGSVTVTASGSVAPYQYSIDGGTTWQGSGMFNGLSAGSYTVIAEDANGCQFPVAVTIVEPTAVVGSLDATVDVTCNGATDGEVTVSATGGTTPYQYSIDGGATWQGSGNFTGLGAGAVTVTIEDANGCLTTVNATINEPSAVTGNTTLLVDVSCSGGSDGEFTVAGSGGTSPYQYSTDGGTTWQPTGNFTGLTAGNYTVTIEDANGCQTTVNVTIIEPTPLTGSVVSTTDATCGLANGAFEVAGAGSSPPYQYSIDGGTTWQGSGVFNGMTAGSYTVTIEDSKGCQTTVNVVINDLSGITASITAQTDVTCNGGNDGSVTVTASGSVSPYQYSIDGGTTWQASGLFNGLSAGNYTVIAEDANGCQFPVAITILEPTAVVGSFDSSTDVTCNGGNDGDITVSATGGTTPYLYSIDGGTTWQAAGTFSGLAAGSYTITIEDAAGCQTTVNTTVIEPTAVGGVIAGTVDVSCNGGNDGSLNVLGNGGISPYQYSIDGGVTWQPSGSFGTLYAGNYTVTIEDANGCQTTINVTINEPPALNAAASTVQDATGAGLCDGIVTATPTGGTSPYSYQWDDGFAQITQVAGALCAGTYCVVITDAMGCVDSACTVVIEPGMIGINSTQVNIDCNGNCNGSIDVTVTGGVTPYGYSWAGPAGYTSTLEDPTGLCAGTYDLIVTDANTITSTHQVIITEPTPLVAIIDSTNDALCNGSCDGEAYISVSGSVPPYTYAWTGPGGFSSTNEDITGLCMGTYDVTITDANFCTTTLNLTINEPTPIVLVTGSTNSNCGQADGSVDVVASGGTVAGSYGYLWENSTPSVVGTTSLVTGLPAGSYTVTVTDDNGCTATTTQAITDVGGGTASTTADIMVSCNGLCDGQASVIMAGGTTPFTYAWSSGNTPTAATTDGLCAGTHSITVTDAVGCIAVETVDITEPAPLSASTTTIDEVCIGDCQGSITIIGTGGTTPYQYSFDNGVTYGGLDTQGSFCAGTHDLVIMDANGCVFNLTADILPGMSYADATIQGFGPLCEDTPPVSMNSPGTGGVWSGPGVTGNQFDASSVGPGTYTITHEISSTCGDTATFDVTVLPLPTVSFVADVTSGCEPLTVTFTYTGDPASLCFWDFGDGNTSTDCGTVTHTYSSYGVYDVSLIITDFNDCVNSVIYPGYIQVYEMPVAAFTAGPQPTTILNATINFTDQSYNAAQWDWDFDGLGSSTSQNPSFNFDNVGNYDIELVVTSPDGCTDTVVNTIYIGDEFLIYVPNAITADNDGINDVFFPVMNAIDPLHYELYIFNRWGELIFEAHNPTISWDGSYKGTMVQQDVYVWKIIVKDNVEGDTHEYIGHVTVLKQPSQVLLKNPIQLIEWGFLLMGILLAVHRNISAVHR